MHTPTTPNHLPHKVIQYHGEEGKLTQEGTFNRTFLQMKTVIRTFSQIKVFSSTVLSGLIQG